MSVSKRLLLRYALVVIAASAAAWLVITEPFVLPVDLPPHLAIAAPQRCLAIFVLCMSLWLTNLIPHGVTGLLAVALLPTLGVLEQSKALSLFGNSAVFFMLGVFLLAGAMITTGLSKRITFIALQRFDKSPDHLVKGIMLSAMILSLMMPSYAVAAMIYPIVVEIVAALELPRGNTYAKKLFLALAWGAIIGSCGTMLGGARAPLALSLLHEAHPESHITFLQWMIATMPIVLIMGLFALNVLKRRIPNNLNDITAATTLLHQTVSRLGKHSPREKRLLTLWLVTIAAWVTLGQTIGLAVIAMLSAVTLFLLRIVEWNAVQRYINWGVLLMYGGAVALGAALAQTQAMAWLAGQIMNQGASPMIVITGLVILTVALTETISNAAAVAILLPIGYSLGELSGVGPITVTLAVTVSAGLAFLLPVSSPPSAISFSAGHYGVREVIRLGWPVTLVGITVVLGVVLFWWNMVLKVDTW